MSVIPSGRMGRAEGARRVRVKLEVSAAYRSAERVLGEFGEVVSVVKETWEAVLAENAVEGMPSLAASHAAPL